MTEGRHGPHSVAVLATSSADRRLLHQFVDSLGHRVFESDPHTLRLSEIDDVDLVLTDRASASHHRDGLLALKQRHSGWLLPMLVLMPPHGDAAPWLHGGFDDVLRYPISKADLTARLQTHLHRRRESQAAYRNIFLNAPVGLYRTDPQGRVLMANPAMARMLGYGSSQELVGIVLQRAVPPEDVASAGAGLPVIEREARWRRRDGTEVIVQEQSRAIHDGNGDLLYFEGTVEDITEKRRLQHQLLQSQKMEALGRLAGGISHDFNNLLTVIVTSGEILRMDLETESPLLAEVEDILDASQRAAALTRQLLAFSSRQPADLRPGNLNEVVREVERLLRRTIAEDIELVLDLADALSTIRLDPIQIEQVLVNLVVNARDAMPQGGRLTLRTRNVENAGIAGIVLSVSDTGAGMDAETQSRLWEPFFSTKGKRGTGLGLPTVYGIVAQLGGRIDVESAPGAGSTFEIFLPAIDEAPAERRPAPMDVDLPTGSETLLVVEDEEAVLQGVVRLLRRLGYEVVEARGAGEALLKAEQLAGKIDLLLTDVVMPDMSGPELVSRLGDRLSSPVLFVSGYTGDHLDRHAAHLAGAALLPKPFTTAELATAVRRALDGARRGA